MDDAIGMREIGMPPHDARVIAFHLRTDLKRRVVSPRALILSFVLAVALTLGATGLDHGLPYFPKSVSYQIPIWQRNPHLAALLEQDPI